MTLRRTRSVSVTTGLRNRAWWVMRRRRVFTLPELLSTIADGSEKNADGNLGRWLRILTQAGILTRDEKRVGGVSLTSNGFYRYRLARDLGRKAPVWRGRENVVFDPNSGESISLPVSAGVGGDGHD